ncbi:pilus assembly protein [Allosphingosinicella flava]|uniref:Pilus assembly protein n=1 Tax=Allosphingosinicella flava TaxID=2771430 RepID=A0A7T2GL59_9SPHN|nr:TadE family protein [Sphingosinicella flava]QPQ55881.1 pilus assembly protein [Sphingosinicella flava]
MIRPLRRDERGASTLEFALVAPALILFLIGIPQIGMLYFANAGLNNALAEGARQATLWPRPDEAQIKARIAAGQFGLKPSALTIAPLAYGNSDGADYAEITMRYNVQLDFGFFRPDPILLQKSRRVYLQRMPAP